MNEDRLGALLASALPEQGPALQGQVLLAGARLRTRRRRQLSVAGTIALVALVAVLVPRTGAARTSPVDRPNLPSEAPFSLTGYRLLPDDALVQINTALDHGPVRSPRLPDLGTRVYQDGTVLSGDGTTQALLSAEQLRQLRDLLTESALDQGGRDYGTPTNEAGAFIFQVAGAAPSDIEIGGTVNGIPPSDAQLTPEQRAARAAGYALADLLAKASASGGAATVTQWSRYSERKPSLRQSMPLDVAAYPEWTAGRLDAGTLVRSETYCLPTSDPKTDSGLSSLGAEDTSLTMRVDDMPWYITYAPVIRGESACSLTPLN